MSSTNESHRSPNTSEGKLIIHKIHEDSVIALIYLVTYDELFLRRNVENPIEYLHGLHLEIDNLVQTYGFYKADFSAGTFIIAANVVGEATSDVPRQVLEFVKEVQTRFKSITSPVDGGPVEMWISLSANSVHSAIFGKTALKYSVYGRAEVNARRLLECYGGSKETVDKIIASEEYHIATCIVLNCFGSFVDKLNGNRADWKPLPVSDGFGNLLANDRAYVHDPCSCSPSSSSSSSAHHVSKPFLYHSNALLCLECNGIELL